MTLLDEIKAKCSLELRESRNADVIAAEISKGRLRIESITIDPGVMHLEVEVTGNTGQAVTCEAFLSEISSASTTG